LRILLVDDSPSLLRAMSRLLRRAGFAVVAANGAEEAVAAAFSGSFDLAIVDLEMPGADGWATIERLVPRAGSSSPPSDVFGLRHDETTPGCFGS